MESNKEKPCLYMMVGIPGCGKSSYANSLGGEVFSSDKLREELWGSEETQGDNHELFSELQRRIRERLKFGATCVHDATNISAKKRASFLRELKGIDCKKICIFMATDIELCLERNEERGRSVPVEVIDRMYRQIEIPQYREGWDEIRVIQTRKDGKEYDIFATMDRLKKISHDNPHHMLTIGDHIIAVANHIAKVYAPKISPDLDRMENLLEAAFYHDIGKEYTKSFLNEKGEKTDIAHYYGHEHVSAYLYFLYISQDEINGCLDDCLYTTDLIQFHMRMHNIGVKDKEKSLAKIQKIVGMKKYQDLLMLKDADETCA